MLFYSPTEFPIPHQRWGIGKKTKWKGKYMEKGGKENDHKPVKVLGLEMTPKTNGVHRGLLNLRINKQNSVNVLR